MKINPIAAIRSAYRTHREEQKQRQLDKQGAAFLPNSSNQQNVAEGIEDAMLALNRLTKGTKGHIYKKYDAHGDEYYTTKRHSRHENRVRPVGSYYDEEDEYQVKRSAVEQQTDAGKHLEIQLKALIQASDDPDVIGAAQVFVDGLFNSSTQKAAPPQQMKAMIANLAKAIENRRAAA